MEYMSVDEFRAAAAKSMPEKQFQEKHVVPALRRHGFTHIFHVHDSRHSPAGFPDILAIRGHELHVVELKREGKEATVEQQSWLYAFRQVAGIVVHGVWRPSMIGRLDEVLR